MERVHLFKPVIASGTAVSSQSHPVSRVSLVLVQRNG